MNQNYIIPNNWSIIEEGYAAGRVKSSESLFSLGNGAMGQRANFEEHYSGPTFQGSYIGGVYYPDKTRVGWWKNGYPEYFAKVLNAPNWIGINLHINGERLDLNACKKVDDFRRELNMKEGWYERRFTATLQNGTELRVVSKRFLSLTVDELGAIAYSVTPLNADAKILAEPYLDSGIRNEDTNWEEHFWETLDITQEGLQACIVAKTLKTHFHVGAFMQLDATLNGTPLTIEGRTKKTSDYIGIEFEKDIRRGQTLTIYKYGGYVTDMNHDKDRLVSAAKNVLKKTAAGFSALLEQQKDAWRKIWETADIVIEGDVKAQQGIR
ncbi:MAG: glycoside hydrolase family 65 protein, partial [Sinomicrobium sp.]|nr:glycoside hydrolase family 65 protein [Sinomicrobium sp.]